MDGCDNGMFGGESSKTLNVVAVCTDESMTAFGYTIDKNLVWIVLTITEIVQCFAMFLLVLPHQWLPICSIKIS